MSESALHPYLKKLTLALKRALEPSLRGVYLSGSAAAGAFRPGDSDVDVLVAVDAAHAAQLDALVTSCSHAALPCPAAKLELVVYELAALKDPGGAPQWSLNFDTGPGVNQVDHDPASQPSHWFVLDLAFARRHGVPLLGPPAVELIADPGEAALRLAFAEQVAWYERHEPAAAELAARRARHWLATGEFASKLQLQDQGD
jgi:hypothetical protein